MQSDAQRRQTCRKNGQRTRTTGSLFDFGSTRTVPKASEIEQSVRYLATECIDDFEVVYRMIVEFHTHNVVQYKFEDEGEQVPKKEQDDFTGEINDAISDGEMTPPKSKKLDLLPRLATKLHVFIHTMQWPLSTLIMLKVKNICSVR